MDSVVDEKRARWWSHSGEWMDDLLRKIKPCIDIVKNEKD